MADYRGKSPDDFDFTDLPPEDAIEYFRRKSVGQRFSFDWRDVWQEEHARSFVVAKAMTADILEDIHGAVDQAIADGIAFEDFRDHLEPILRAKGWWGRQEMTDPLTGVKRDVQLGSVRRLQIIYDTNLRTSYAAGNWAQIQRTKELLPYLRYVDPDPNPRPQHLDWSGTVLRADDSWWDTHFTPNGWNCKCYVDSLSDKDLERRGYQLSAAGPSSGTYAYVNPRTGTVSEIPVGIDPGFGHNPGKAGLAYAASLALAEKLATAAPEIARAVEKIKPSPANAGEWAAVSPRIQRLRRDAEELSAEDGPAMERATGMLLDSMTPRGFDTYVSYTRNPISRFNRPLRAASPMRADQQRLVELLGHLPKYQGVVWRGIATGDAAAMVREWQEAGIVSDAAFQSASLSEEVARRFAGQQGILLKLHSRTGVYMAPASVRRRLRAEDEVLFRPKRTFRILAVHAPPADERFWIVEAEEE